MTSAVSEGSFATIAVLDPKSNPEVAGLFVVQLIVTDVLPITLVRFEMTGGFTSSVDEGADGDGGGGAWVAA